MGLQRVGHDWEANTYTYITIVFLGRGWWWTHTHTHTNAYTHIHVYIHPGTFALLRHTKHPDHSPHVVWWLQWKGDSGLRALLVSTDNLSWISNLLQHHKRGHFWHSSVRHWPWIWASYLPGPSPAPSYLVYSTHPSNQVLEVTDHEFLYQIGNLERRRHPSAFNISTSSHSFSFH